MTTNTDTASLDFYFSQIKNTPTMSREEEIAVARRMRENQNGRAAQQLVEANLRFVVKIAHEYRGYGLSLIDLVQEGNVGLIMAVRKFDPDKGYRLISYAVWWIRAYIQNYIMRSWSLVKIGTTQAQRKLFYKLRSEKQEPGPSSTLEGSEKIKAIALRLGVSEETISEMDARLAARDFSLDAQAYGDGEGTFVERLADSGEGPERALATHELRTLTRQCIVRSMADLNKREGIIVTKRLMADEPETLQQLGERFRISRERVRQIEATLLGKLRTAFHDQAPQSVAA